MNNLDKIAECARMAVVFYEQDDQENLGTALKMLCEKLAKKCPGDLPGQNSGGRKDDGSIKPWIVY